MFDSPLGLAIRRWCAPVLGLPIHSRTADDYWARRSELGPDELSQAMLTRAGVSRWIVDTGFKGDLITTLEQLTELSGSPSSEILRLERLAEDLLEADIIPYDFPDAFRSALQARGGLAGRRRHQDDCGLPHRFRHRLVAPDRCAMSSNTPGHFWPSQCSDFGSTARC